VAASCAAILAVYAAGYWRTRDEARRLDTSSQARRPERTIRPPPVARLSTTASAGRASVPVQAVPIQQVPVAGNGRSSAEPAQRRGLEPPPSREVPPSEQTSPAVPAILPVPAEPEQLPATQALVVAATPEPASSASSESPWHDGTYTGWGLSRHGDIEARVTIKHGGIVAVGIATCATRYPCYVIDEILQQPLFRQSADVDTVSRATESSDAYSDAVWQALQKAEAGPVATASP